MSDADQPFLEDLDAAPPRGYGVKRVLTRIIVAICGVLMAVVLLSEPRVMQTIETGGAQFMGMFDGLGATEADVEPEGEPAPTVTVRKALAQNTTEPAGTETQRPSVSVIPQSQVPVRRLSGN
ncbi:MAG: hypothetical protein AAFR45_09920 [Pseudomonadota bacterium]